MDYSLTSSALEILLYIHVYGNFDKYAQEPVVLDSGVESVRMEATVFFNPNRVKIPASPGKSYWGSEKERLFQALFLTPVDSFFLPPDTDCRLPWDGTR